MESQAKRSREWGEKMGKGMKKLISWVKRWKNSNKIWLKEKTAAIVSTHMKSARNICKNKEGTKFNGRDENEIIGKKQSEK